MGIVSKLGGAVLGFRDKRDGFMTKLTKDEIRTSTDADFKAVGLFDCQLGGPARGFLTRWSG